MEHLVGKQSDLDYLFTHALKTTVMGTTIPQDARFAIIDGKIAAPTSVRLYPSEADRKSVV